MPYAWAFDRACIFESDLVRGRKREDETQLGQRLIKARFGCPIYMIDQPTINESIDNKSTQVGFTVLGTKITPGQLCDLLHAMFR